MNRKDFLKSLLALPFVPSILKRASNRIVKVAWQGQEPDMVLTVGDTSYEYSSAKGDTGYNLDIVSIDADGFTLSLEPYSYTDDNDLPSDLQGNL